MSKKNQQLQGPEGPSKNPLSEKVIDFVENIIIPKGTVLLELVEKESAASDLYLPDTVDKASLGGVYYVVVKVGDEEFAKKVPEFTPHTDTQKGNIVISLKPNMSKLYTNNNKEYILVPDPMIECQVAPEFFKGFD